MATTVKWLLNPPRLADRPDKESMESPPLRFHRRGANPRADHHPARAAGVGQFPTQHIVRRPPSAVRRPPPAARRPPSAVAVPPRLLRDPTASTKQATEEPARRGSGGS
ncbi:hypothetical protein [Kribbella sp. NPDC023855]|uniref:hypothetical protein n=1 Tax=Kribbella sp. NPDC023855 TaxID=3154698 RepID=UPI0033DC9414